MLIVRILLISALLTAQPALAETLSTATGDPAAAAARPDRGSSMATVHSRYGEPTNRHSAVGDPPITRWDYPQFAVYFEHDRVLHAVLVK
ncbi:MAG TPA: hypothetical protein VML92_05655 [Steroidobacteraceae bacterium]|nr:hypothetical protein [Steroidobacteraceae bacterium]